ALRHPLRPTLFPYTTLFRSRRAEAGRRATPAARPAVAAQDALLQRRPQRQADASRRGLGREPEPPAPCRVGAVRRRGRDQPRRRSEEHTSELQSLAYLVCRL